MREYAPGDVVRVKKGTMLVETGPARGGTSRPPVGSVATVVRLPLNIVSDDNDIIYLTFWCRPGVEWITWTRLVTPITSAQINGDNSDV